MVLHGHSDLRLHWHRHPCTTFCVTVSRCLQYPGGPKGGMSDLRRFVSDGAIQRAHPKVISGVLCHLPPCQVCLSTHTHILPAWQSIVTRPHSEHCPALSLLLEFPSTASKAPALLSLMARTHIQQAEASNPAGRHA